MNKYQKSLNEIVKNSCPRKTDCYCCDISTRCNSLMKGKINILQELVDKETPKKLFYEGDGCWNGELIYDTAICPSCSRSFEIDCDEKSKFCPNCGQALDWGDD